MAKHCVKADIAVGVQEVLTDYCESRMLFSNINATGLFNFVDV